MAARPGDSQAHRHNVAHPFRDEDCRCELKSLQAWRCIDQFEEVQVVDHPDGRQCPSMSTPN